MTNYKQLYFQLQHDAETIAKKAMEILSSMQGKETIFVQKDEIDISTSADIAAEKCIVDFIKKTYPTHGIYSEEMKEVKGTDAFRWVIDPLDQTKEYTRGLSEYNCLIGIEYDKNAIVGVTLQHGIDTLYSASQGNGVTMNGKSIHVSGQSNVDNAFVGFNLPNKKMGKDAIDENLRILRSLLFTVYRVRPFWDQSKAMAWVSQGLLDGNIAPFGVFKWHDVASSISIVKEAGGTVTNFSGDAITEESAKNGIIASNGIIHEQLLNLVSKGGPYAKS